jgi:quercetin dioxygenase-like cupin family protein
MTEMPDLRTALLDILYETRTADLKLIIGGGYGLYLKRQIVRDSGIQTLLTEWPEARSTNDLDLFLRPELLIHSARLKPLAQALPRLGYTVIPEAEKYQFVRPGPRGDQQGSVKVDLLTGPGSNFEGTHVKVDKRRARPKPSIDLHAHPTDEAITLEEGLLAITVEGATSGGALHRGEVYLPHPFTFALMKLFAYRDRSDDADKQYGRYHALDLYSIIAMMTETEWTEALRLRGVNANSPTLVEARSIVGEHFSTRTSLGILRLCESAYYRPAFQLNDFLAAFKELFHEIAKGPAASSSTVPGRTRRR